jgi:hypothetical protein
MMRDSEISESEIIEEAKTTIRSAIQRSWSAKKEAILLSRLGVLIGNASELIRSELRMKLAEFIRAYMKDEVFILNDPERPGVQGVIPPEGYGLDHHSLFAPKIPKTPSGSPALPNYHRAFWSAFRAPAQTGTKRFIIGNGHQCEFLDQPESLPAPEGGVELQKHWLPAPDEFRSRDAVHSAIKGWSTENGISPQRYVWIGGDAGTEPAQVRGQNLLDRIIHALTEEQLHRLTLNGDIIKKLLRS